jgi:hypothetical protein
MVALSCAHAAGSIIRTIKRNANVTTADPRSDLPDLFDVENILIKG